MVKVLHILIVKFLAKRNVSDNVLNDRAYEIPRNPKYDGYQRGLASMTYKFFWQENKIDCECKWRKSWRINQASD